VAAYQSIFDMQIIRSERVAVGDTAMNSHVLRDAAGLTYVMAEPDPTRAPGQVDQFPGYPRQLRGCNTWPF